VHAERKWSTREGKVRPPKDEKNTQAYDYKAKGKTGERLRETATKNVAEERRKNVTNFLPKSVRRIENCPTFASEIVTHNGQLREEGIEEKFPERENFS